MLRQRWFSFSPCGSAISGSEAPVCGAGLAEIAVILSLIITVGIFLLDRLPVARAPMLLVVNASDLDAENAILDVVNTYARHPAVKSRSMTSAALDLTIEVRTDKGSELIRNLMRVPGVTAASLLRHDGEVTF